MRKAKLVALWLTGVGVLAFVIGVLLDGPDGDRVGIYCGFSGLMLVAVGILTLFALGCMDDRT
jgi:hypothetical protein